MISERKKKVRRPKQTHRVVYFVVASFYSCLSFSFQLVVYLFPID